MSRGPSRASSRQPSPVPENIGVSRSRSLSVSQQLSGSAAIALHGLPSARRNEGRRPSRPEFQQPVLPKQTQGGLGIVGVSGDLYTTCPAPTSRRASGQEHKEQHRQSRHKPLAGAGASMTSNTVAARPDLPSLPWARPREQDHIEHFEAAEVPAGPTLESTLIEALADLGETVPTPLGLSPPSQIKFKSLANTLDKLDADKERVRNLWSSAHRKVSAMNALSHVSKHDETESSELGASNSLLGASVGASTDASALNSVGLDGSFGKTDAGKTDAGTTDASRSDAALSRLADMHPSSQEQAGNTGSTGDQEIGAPNHGNPSSAHSVRANGFGEDDHRSTSKQGRGRSPSPGRASSHSSPSRRKGGTEQNDDASRGKTRRSTRRRSQGQNKLASVQKTISQGRPESKAEMEDFEDDAEVEDDILDEFLEELFDRYSRTQDNRGRPLLNNIGVRKFLMDFSYGPGASVSAAAESRLLGRADVLYDEEIERQSNMNFVYDLSKGEAGRGLCYKAFLILLKQVKLPSSSKALSRRWFIKYSAGVTNPTASNVADAMYNATSEDSGA